MKQRRRRQAVRRWFADHRRAVLWSTAGFGATAVAVIALVDSWLDATLSAAVVLGLWLVLAWFLPPGAAAVSRRINRQGPIAALPSPATLFDRWRARSWRRALARALTDASLSLPTQLEVVSLLMRDADEEILAELRPLASDPQTAPEVRLQIAAGLADRDHILATRTYRAVAADEDVPVSTQLTAAELLYAHSRQAGEPFLQSIVKSTDIPDTLRLQAAAAYTAGEPESMPVTESASLLAYLVGESAVSAEVRFEAAQQLTRSNPARATRALWTLANDPLVDADRRFAAIALLQQADPVQALHCYKAMAHDPSLPWAVRMDAAVRLGGIDEADGRLMLQAFLRDPDLDERTNFEIVRKLTLDM
ncbi:hypothetical protein [Glycomyces sp. MUSA5-2]|uniref:hypothetical protein n=1 Tax=Glycomyces sp. MUSA5-2 TaxID=2053002 RepID=UPI00300A26E7